MALADFSARAAPDYSARAEPFDLGAPATDAGSLQAGQPDFSGRAKPAPKGSFLFPGVSELTQMVMNTPNDLPDPNKPEESFLGALPKQLRTAADTTAQTGLGLAQRMLESPPSPNIPLSENDMAQPPDFALRAREAVIKDNPLQNLSQALDRDIKANTANVKPFSASGITGQILSSAPPMIAAAAATAVTKSPLLGASMVGASVFGQEYSQERAHGISPEWADLGAAVNGFSESLGEEIPLGMLMRPGSKFLTGTLKVAGAEGLQEFLTQIVQTGYDKGVLDPTMTWGQVWASVLQAGIVGGIMGGGLNIAAHPFRGKELTPEQQKILNTSSSELLRQAKAAKDLRSKPNAPIPENDYAQTEETPEEKEIKGLTQGIDKDTLEGARYDVDAYNSPEPKGTGLLQTIRQFGGVKLTDRNGETTKEGQDFRGSLGDTKMPGLVNNQTGLTPDYLREKLKGEGWFGYGDQGADIQDLYDLVSKEAKEGTKVYHPESDTENSLQRRKSLDEEYHHAGITDKDGPELAAAKLSKFRDNYRLIEQLHTKAKEIGLKTNNSWDIPELTAEIADHEAHLYEKQDIINPDVVSGTMEDYERGIDEYLHKNLPEYLDDLISRTGAAPESLKTPGHEVSNQNGNAPTGGTLGLEEPNQGAGVGRQGAPKSLPAAKAALGRKGLGQQVLGLFNRPLEKNTTEPLEPLHEEAPTLPLIGGKPPAMQTAYHGSPYDFDKFKNEAIGSGEGAAAYGYGHYFAGKKEVAEFYRDKLAKGHDLSDAQLEDYFKPGRIVNGYGGRDKVIAFHPGIKEPWRKWSVEVVAVDKDGNALPGERVRDHSTQPTSSEYERVTSKKLGKLYHVDLTPKEDEWLDWDRPLSKQSVQVKAAIEQFIGDKRTEVPLSGGRGATMYRLKSNFGGAITNASGADLYHHLTAGIYADGKADSLGRAAKLASETLRDAGVPGIRYLDQGSRNTGEGTHNYVVFDPNHIQIEAKFQRKEGDGFKTNPGALAQEHADEVRSTETRALQDAANRRPNWQRVAKGLEGILPEERQANEIRAKVEKTLRKIVPKSRLVIAGNLRDQAGEVFGAAFERQTPEGTRSLIALSVRSGNAIRTALHEAIHALKRNGFFSLAEWTALKEGAENGGWLDQYKIQSTYPDLTHDAQLEEAIAERFSEWMSNRGLWLPKSIRPIFIKLAKLVMLIRGHVKEVFGGKLTADEVMARIDSGSVGNRPSPHVVSPENTQMARRKAPTPKGLPLPPTPPVVKTLRDKIREAQIRAFGEGIEKLHDGARSLFTKVMPTSVVDFMRPFTEGMGTLHRAFLLGTVPMSVGTPESRAIAKDFITNLRETNYQYRLLDDHIVKHYARDSRKAMWDQAEEENAFALKGKTPGPAEGINKLTADEKALVLQIKKLGDKVFATAQALGMVKGPGVPFWTPRMIVEMTRGLGGGVEVRRAGKAPQKYTSDIGRNLSTTAGSLKERKYQFAHETEAAAKLKFGSNVEIVPDIRTSVLALQKIEHAIAGREFVNRIRDYGLTIGASLVSTSKPNSEDWFTLEHPAFYERELEFIKDPTSGKMIPKTDQFGNLIFHGNQLWIHKDFEGPMKAVLNKKSEVWYNGIMSLKGKQMSLIMFSPIMHNAVIWGKAIPADPLNVGLFQIYGKGATVIADKAEMSRAIKSGVDPVGRRYFNQDITAIAEQQEGKLLKPGRSITANLVAAIPGLFDKAAGVKVKEFIDKWGDIWHNKYLWDQVFKLQMGIWKSISDSQVKQGMTQSSADRIGAHFANRYAGSLPMESMSKLARQLANLVFFSRSFTFSNLGSWKDFIQGLPRDLQGQILRDEGKLQLSRVQGVARRKAAAMLAIDIGLSWAGLSLAAMAIASIRKMIFGDDDGIVWPSENEPGKEFRVFIGYDEDGTALYARFAWGKVGEEMLDWVTEPREEVLKKQSPQARVAYAIASNDTGFGMQMYDPNYKPEGPVDYLWQWAKYAGKAIGMVITGSGPALFVENLYGLLTDTAHMGSHALATILPPLGITVSHGAPGGPAVGEMYAGRQSQEFKIRESLAGWRDRIRNGDDQAVRTEMREAGMDPYTIQAIIRTTKNPKLRLTPRAQRQFNLYATPEQKQRLDNARARQP